MPDRQNSPDRERTPNRDPNRDPGRQSPGRERESDPRRGSESPDQGERDYEDDRSIRRADDAGSAGTKH